jgi:21S rRNA (GM2251-2'-O)-methyltransferase
MSTSATIAAVTTDSSSTVAETGPSLWLALDEVVDPQNLGALLRSAYFLGGGDAGSINDDYESALDNNNRITHRGKVGIIVCSKNSSPLSPTVSAASAGAVEFMSIYSTTNLPKLLYTAQEDGWQVFGAAADVPDGTASRNNHDDDNDSIDDNEDDYNEWVMSNEGSDDDDSSNVDNSHVGSSSISKLKPQCFDLHEVKTGNPTIIVLGSEGRGLRTLVSRACTGFVRIPGGGGGSVLGDSSSSIDNDDDKNDENKTRSGVDSLNVSVTGGILLWHFLSKQ